MTTIEHGKTDEILWFSDLGVDDVELVGGKGANLGELTTAGLPVPDGFVISAAAYLAAMDHGGVRDRLRDIAAEVDATDPSALAQASIALQDLVRKVGVPARLRQAIVDGYRRLGDDVAVAVRSSATSEDTAISVNPDAVDAARQVIANAERRMLLDAARDAMRRSH